MLDSKNQKLRHMGHLCHSMIAKWLGEKHSLDVNNSSRKNMAARLLGMVVLSTAPASAQINTSYSTSWMGNNFAATYVPSNGVNDYLKYVQGSVDTIAVMPDGTVYTHTLFDEAGRRMGVYKDGDALLDFDSNQSAFGTQLAVNSTYAYATDGEILTTGKIKIHDVQIKRMSIATRALAGWTDNAGAILSVSGYVNGLACDNSFLYASTQNGNVRVYDANTMALVRSIAVPGARRLALETDGGFLWVVTGNNTLKRYSTIGSEQAQIITLPSTAVIAAVSIDSSNRLLIADNGPDRNVKIYSDLTSTPSQSATLGNTGGLYSGTPGIVTPLKFHDMTGVGVDSSGNIYVSMLGSLGTMIEKYSGSTMSWRLMALPFEEPGIIDPADETQYYSPEAHYTMDWSKSNGEEATLKGILIAPGSSNVPNPAVPGDDGWFGNGAAAIRTLGGKKFLYAKHQGGAPLTLYRIESGTETTTRGTFNDLGYSQIRVDENGNLWSPDADQNLVYWQYGGLDGSNWPIYPANPQLIQIPAPFYTTTVDAYPLNFCQYFPASDTMYLAGTKASGGAYVMCRYNNWSGSRTIAWEKSLNDARAVQVTPKSIDIAGDYIFTGYFGMYGIVNVYSTATGLKVNEFNYATYNVFTPGVMWASDADNVINVRAYKRSNGEYIVSYLDHLCYKDVMYRWTPGSGGGVTGLVEFRQTHHLAAGGSNDRATPAGDGVANLLKYAFNMIGTGVGKRAFLNQSNTSTLVANGNSGLPLVGKDTSGRMTLSYIRRKTSGNPGLSYSVEFNSSLGIGEWATSSTATEFVSDIDASLERVTVTETAAGSARRFARVKITTL